MRTSFGFSRGKLIVPPVHMRHVSQARPIMALDTGARLTVITPRVAQELGFPPDEIEPDVSIIGATGSASAALLRVASVSIRGMEVRRVRVLCHPLPPTLGLDDILGLDFLRHFDIEIANSTETMTLTRWRE
ncbi:MAG: retropepsin-like aspartic protease family protein [Planctomycetota bacterium]|jgi:predicted aspartyl protease